MIIVALGANLPSRFGSPPETLYAALRAMAEKDIWPVEISRVWRSAPVPFEEGQPWYYNAVAAVKTSKSPHELLKTLLEIEEEFGRVRSVKNTPRILDLDLVAYHDDIVSDGQHLIVPHPRMDTRAFVLMPMSDILDEWVHPQSRKTLDEMIGSIPEDQIAEPVEGGWGA